MGAPGADLLTPRRGLVICTDDSRTCVLSPCRKSLVDDLRPRGRETLDIAVASLKTDRLACLTFHLPPFTSDLDRALSAARD